MVILTGNVRLKFCAERARGWISEYSEPSRGEDRLPESLQRRVEHQQSFSANDGSVPPPRKPLILERAGKRLVVRFAEDSS